MLATRENTLKATERTLDTRLELWLVGERELCLPIRGGVTGVELRAGDRLLRGQLLESAEARRQYELAAARGWMAVLVEKGRSEQTWARWENLPEGAAQLSVSLELLPHEGLADLEHRFRAGALKQAAPIEELSLRTGVLSRFTAFLVIDTARVSGLVDTLEGRVAADAVRAAEETFLSNGARRKSLAVEMTGSLLREQGLDLAPEELERIVEKAGLRLRYPFGRTPLPDNDGKPRAGLVAPRRGEQHEWHQVLDLFLWDTDLVRALAIAVHLLDRLCDRPRELVRAARLKSEAERLLRLAAREEGRPRGLETWLDALRVYLSGLN